jgi:hypothetical protein
MVNRVDTVQDQLQLTQEFFDKLMMREELAA